MTRMMIVVMCLILTTAGPVIKAQGKVLRDIYFIEFSTSGPEAQVEWSPVYDVPRANYRAPPVDVLVSTAGNQANVVDYTIHDQAYYTIQTSLPAFLDRAFPRPRQPCIALVPLHQVYNCTLYHVRMK